MQDKGFILIAMVLIMLILAVTAITLSRRSGLRMHISGNRVDSAQATKGLIAAREKGFWQLTRDPFWWQSANAGTPYAYQGVTYTRSAGQSDMAGFEDAVQLTLNQKNSGRTRSFFYRYNLEDQLEAAKPTRMCVDSSGNIYYTDPDRHAVYRIDGTTLDRTLFAGNGTAGYSGDSGPALSATLHSPRGIAYNGSNHLLYIADTQNHVIRQVELQAIPPNITTLAGNGTAGYSGDGGPAADAQLDSPYGVAYNDSGKYVYITDTLNHRIRQVDLQTASKTITNVAGTGTAGYSGAWGASLYAELNHPQGIVYEDSQKVIIFADTFNHRVRAVALDYSPPTILPLAGDGTPGYTGDGGEATLARLNHPQDVTYDTASVYVADTLNHAVRKLEDPLDYPPTISTLAGSGSAGFTGDNAMSRDAKLDAPQGVTWSSAHGLLVADSMNGALRKIAPPLDGTGTITSLFSGEDPGLHGPSRLDLKGENELYIADSENHRIRKLNIGNGTMTTLAGTGTQTFADDSNLGDNGQAVNATLDTPRGLAFDAVGNLFIADTLNHRVRKMDTASGLITTVAGTGTADHTGDGGPAGGASLNAPHDLAFDSAGGLFIADTGNHCIRKVDQATGIISTVAGRPEDPGYSSGPAHNAELYSPKGIFFDEVDNLYIADAGNHRVRMVSGSGPGLISDVAGSGTDGYSGDGGPATSGQLQDPMDVGLDGAGNVYIADQGNQRIRVVSVHDGYIYTLAGSGSQGYNGTGLPAVQADLDRPSGLAMADKRGPRRIYVADTGNNRIRVLKFKMVKELY